MPATLLLIFLVSAAVGFVGTTAITARYRRAIRAAYIAGLLEGVESMNRRWAK